jgi:hypothetical protein
LTTLTAKALPIDRTAPAIATSAPAGKRSGGWPRGKPRGPRRPADKATRLVAQRKRDAEKKRAARAAARAAPQAKPGSPETTLAQTLWQHAEKLQPKAPSGGGSRPSRDPPLGRTPDIRKNLSQFGSHPSAILRSRPAKVFSVILTFRED